VGCAFLSQLLFELRVGDDALARRENEHFCTNKPALEPDFYKTSCQIME
jgi:hypothetical protein